ncbi:MAG: DUF418 domain-containing protein [Gammaproteobacteria bacterium]|nr:DUF418 domain-containing protein [Gammaproteobacteria bacterium]MYF03412.1 DUF418 domain-containing protein [Gammaproteobacteria bacterium]MYI78265.1 DUF418 domain-containing protein [Gammaproteobacteria bacterium]
MSTENFVPTAPSQRIESIDVLRGWVVLGILTINIVFFGLPYVVGGNPTLFGTFEGVDVFAFICSQVVFEGAQRTIFSMLFGAGVLLFIERLTADERHTRIGGLYYRRMIGLMLFGLIDMYLLLWFGDIIFLYGFVGLFLYFLRNVSTKTLLTLSGILLVISTLMFGGIQALKVFMIEPGIERALEKVERGEGLDRLETEYLEMYNEFVDVEDQIVQEVEAKQQGYLSAYPYIVDMINLAQWVALPMYSFWDVVLMMMMGMALYRLRVFDASRTVRTYLTMALVGFGIGVSINIYEVYTTVSQNYSISSQVQWTYHLGRLAMAIGYIGAIMLICKVGVLPSVRSSLAAVGRMALTNYLVQSILALVYFILLGYFGQLRYHELYYVVFGIWVLQLVYSPWWLKRFRYGPAEYLWRRWTYGRGVSNRL